MAVILAVAVTGPHTCSAPFITHHFPRCACVSSPVPQGEARVDPHVAAAVCTPVSYSVEAAAEVHHRTALAITVSTCIMRVLVGNRYQVG
jgi:hypothetical protein